MKQQTAVEWLQQKYDECPESFLLRDDFEQAKEMERQQIIDAKKDKLYPVETGGVQYFDQKYGFKKEGTD